MSSRAADLAAVLYRLADEHTEPEDLLVEAAQLLETQAHQLAHWRDLENAAAAYAQRLVDEMNGFPQPQRKVGA